MAFKDGEQRDIGRENKKLRELLANLVEGEDNPCRYDHHGYCQEHGWFGEPGECGIREAREILGLDRSEEECLHDWVDARNDIIKSGEVCLRCGTVRPGNVVSC